MLIQSSTSKGGKYSLKIATIIEPFYEFSLYILTITE